MAINAPIENAGLKYVNGLRVSFNTSTLVDVAEGQCRDVTNINDIELSDVTINSAINGAGGLDEGSLANSTLYAVFAIDDSTKTNPGSALLSTSATSPVMPFGYDMKRRIGWVLTDGSANILPFVQTGNSSTRRVTYDDVISVLSSGNDTSFTDVDCSASIPSTATSLLLECDFTPNDQATSFLRLRRNGSSSATGSAQVKGEVNAVVSKDQVFVPVDSNGIFEYLVVSASDSADISISSYDDEL